MWYNAIILLYYLSWGKDECQVCGPCYSNILSSVISVLLDAAMYWCDYDNRVTVMWILSFPDRSPTMRLREEEMPPDWEINRNSPSTSTLKPLVFLHSSYNFTFSFLCNTLWAIFTLFWYLVVAVTHIPCLVLVICLVLYRVLPHFVLIFCNCVKSHCDMSSLQSWDQDRIL